METKAKYVSIGLFTLCVIAGIFGFVYWIHNTGGMGQRAVYRVRYEGSVSGLLTGSSVLFNGVRAGSVTGLELDPQKPQEVLATIAIDRSTPVRRRYDSRIGLPGFDGCAGRRADRGLSFGAAADVARRRASAARGSVRCGRDAHPIGP